jgi:hypothetical protein
MCGIMLVILSVHQLISNTKGGTMKMLAIITLSMVILTAALNSAYAGNWLSAIGEASPQIQEMELEQAKIDLMRQQQELIRQQQQMLQNPNLNNQTYHQQSQPEIMEFARKYIEVIEELGKRESDPALVFEIKKLTTGPGQLFNKRYSNDASADAKINFFQAKAYILEQRMIGEKRR